MSFNSFIFLLAFLPVTLFIYWMLRLRGHFKMSLYFVTVASFIFYGYEFLKGIPALIVSLVVNYILASVILKQIKVSDNDAALNKKRIDTYVSKIALLIGIIFNVMLLSVFKYGGQFIPLIGTDIIAPGISFYTFCEIALLVECYRGNVCRLTAGEYGFLITFFPKLLEGPIVGPNELLEQKYGKEKLSVEEIYRGILLFSLGLFKKVIIADTLGMAVDYGFNNPDSIHTAEALVVMLSYTLQLYFDFSGYTDMAMALAGFLGFKLPLNFNSPYKAKNIDDFWKRWHISLTKFFTQYIYIPLGGNRKGEVRKYINYLIIFFISGIWHGAGWQFIIWGMMHGVLFVITRMWTDLRSRDLGKVNKENDSAATSDKKQCFIIGRLFDGIKILLTFLYVNVAWVFFRAPSVKAALRLFKSMAELWFPRFNIGLAKCFNMDELWYVLKVLHLDRFEYSIYILMIMILVLLLIMIFKAKNSVSYAMECKINLFSTALIIVLLAWSLLSFEGVATYIYVNF